MKLSVHKRCLQLSVFILFFSSAKAQKPIYFKHYEVEHGLSNNTVLCSVQDKRGFMWFGTIDGLNRFDGYTFKTFRNDPSDPESLGNNSVFSLFAGDEEDIWVGTNKGLFNYDGIKQRFQPILPTANRRVTSICKDKNGDLWFILNNSLCRYNKISKAFQTLNPGRGQANSVCIDYNHNLWVGTSDGYICKYDPFNNSFTAHDLFSKSKKASSKSIEKIYDTKKGTLLVGTLSEGIKLFDLVSETYKDIIIYNQNKTEIFVRDFVQYSDNEYWAASECGIFIYNTDSEKVTLLRGKYNNVYSISDNAVNTLWKDKEGGIWAGTRFGGISYYPYPYTSFKKYFSQDDYNSISGNGVHEILPDPDGNLWIGTEDAGLNKINFRTGEYKHFVPDGKKGSISFSNVHGLLISGDELWIGTFQYGLDRMNLKSEKVTKNYKAGKNSFNSNFIVHLFKSRCGDILVGTWEGLFKYNKPTDDFSLVPGFNFQTQNILEDENGLLWICTLGNGVYTLNQKTGKIESFQHDQKNSNSLSNNMVNGQYMDGSNNLWFATEGGLCKYNPGTRVFKTYTTDNGFPSNFLYKILEDQRKNLWISTTKGLVCFSPATEKLKVFTTANGLLNDQFNWNSAYKDSSGQMFFGSVKGMISFIPEEFTTNNITPPVYITGIQVYNKEIPIGNKNSPLTRSITYTDKITLPYNQSTISIDFAALSYTSPGMNEYSYKMEGLDKDWTLLKTNRKGYFTELTPGSYTFKVKACNSSGVWNPKETSLQIEILPPFWKSNPAYLLYFLTAAGLLYMIFRNYHRRVYEKNKRKMELLDHQKEKDLYEHKIEFFTNVAHEIRTPLTLIRGPMENIMNHVDDVPEIKNNLKIMERNTNRLLEISEQLLDFRQVEEKGFSLNFEFINIAEVLQDVHTNFQILAAQHDLDYELNLPVSEFYCYADPDSIHKILNNLYSNAIKYSSRLVQVRFIPPEQDNKFQIEISNDGFLIPEEMKEKIFEPFVRLKETNTLKGTGIGLAISRTFAELHKGALRLKNTENGVNVFVLELPIHHSKDAYFSHTEGVNDRSSRTD